MNLRSLSLTGLLCAACAFHVAPCAGEVPSLVVWQHIPVLQNGRVMPIDTYARTTLLSFSGRSTFNRQPASRWLARALFDPDSTRGDAIFLVNNPEVVEALGLSAEGRDRYSYAQLEPTLAELTRLARAAFHLEDDARSAVETEVMRLYSNLSAYNRLIESLDFVVPRPEFQITHADLRRDIGLPAGEPVTLFDLESRKGQIDSLLEQHGGSETPGDEYEEQLFSVATALRMRSQGRHDASLAIIPMHGHGADQEWIGAWDALSMGEAREELGALRDMAVAFRDGRQVTFDIAARTYLTSVAKRVADPGQLKMIKAEVVYNKSDAFYRAELLYGFAFLAALLSVPFRGKWMYRAALALVILALVPHTYGIVSRMVIMGRPPVTNLYSTFIFVSWICAALGLAVEYFQCNRLGLITASAMGVALLLTSGRFGTDGDTMGVMVAVLDSNFWLATHVVTVTIGYAGCIAAGLLGHIYLLQALRRAPGDAVLKDTYNAIYGALAFGLIFSFLGTMLGGVWADQSWGRFWGWDPKENGALVIVLWSAIIFHAKLDRLIGPLGFAAGCVLGVIWVLLAWLGVNLLSVGLHSYGFTSGIARGLAIACSVEVLFVLATVPFAKRVKAEG